MARLGCLFVVAVLIAIPAIAAQFLPWWGTLIVILVEAAVLLIGGPRLLSFSVKRFMLNMFLTKSRVLHDAGVHVISVEEVERADDEDEDDDAEDEDEDDESSSDSIPAGTRFVEIEFTVTPRPGNSKMSHWEPAELMIVPFDMKVDESLAWTENEEDQTLSANVHAIEQIDDAGNASEDFDKIVGPARLRAVFAVPPTMKGRVKFRYYFESFGDLRLP